MNDELIQVLSHLNSSVNALKQSVEGLKEWKDQQHSQDLDEALRAAQDKHEISSIKDAEFKTHQVSVKRGPITDAELSRAIEMSGISGMRMLNVLTTFARSRGIL